MMAEGGCFCGAVRYRITAEPVLKAQCHCRACQTYTGGAPNTFLLIPRDGFALTGDLRTFTHPESRRGVTRHFCPTCGTQVTTERPGRDEVILRAGTLDRIDAVYDGPEIAIFCEEKAAFHTIPEGVAAFDRLPPA